jgi:hypothetical protein
MWREKMSSIREAKLWSLCFLARAVHSINDNLILLFANDILSACIHEWSTAPLDVCLFFRTLCWLYLLASVWALNTGRWTAQCCSIRRSGRSMALDRMKGKCALGPFLSILVIECQPKCLNVNLCPWMDKLQIKSKGMFLSLNTLVLCTNILV